MADNPDLTGEEVESKDTDDTDGQQRRRTTPTRRPQAEVRLEKKLQGGLKQLGGIVSRRNERLGEIITDDADKMGRLLATWAQSGPGPLKTIIGFVSEILEPLDAFGRLVGQLVRDFREHRVRAREEWEAEQDAGQGPPIIEE